MMIFDMMVIWVFVGVHLMWDGVDFSFTFYSMAVKDKIRIYFYLSYPFSNKVFSRSNNQYNKLNIYYGKTIMACTLKRGLIVNGIKESLAIEKKFKKIII